MTASQPGWQQRLRENTWPRGSWAFPHRDAAVLGSVRPHIPRAQRVVHGVRQQVVAVRRQRQPLQDQSVGEDKAVLLSGFRASALPAVRRPAKLWGARAGRQVVARRDCVGVPRERVRHFVLPEIPATNLVVDRRCEHLV